MTALIAIAIFVLTQITKKWIIPKFGDTGLHLFIFLIACIGFGVQAAMTHWPGFAVVVGSALKYLVGAIALYEVLIKKFSNTTLY